MKKTIAALAVALALAGCGSGGGGDSTPDNNNHGYGYATDDVSPSGLRLQFRRAGTYRDPVTGAAYSEDLLPGFGTWLDFLERDWQNVKACTGLDAEPPFVILLAPGTLAPNGGLTYSTKPYTVLIEYLQVARHEYVHYLLSVSGFPEADNLAHNSPLFSCQNAGATKP